MTLKATLERLREHICANNLTLWEPEMRSGDVCRRALYVRPALLKWVNQNATKVSELDLQEAVKGRLDAFVVQETIDNEYFMKKLGGNPQDIWEIRVISNPQQRIFGAFLGYNIFIATNKRERDGLSKNNGFRSSMERAASEWGELFPELCRFRADRFDRYVEGGIDLVSIGK